MDARGSPAPRVAAEDDDDDDAGFGAGAGAGGGVGGGRPDPDSGFRTPPPPPPLLLPPEVGGERGDPGGLGGARGTNGFFTLPTGERAASPPPRVLPPGAVPDRDDPRGRPTAASAARRVSSDNRGTIGSGAVRSARGGGDDPVFDPRVVDDDRPEGEGEEEDVVLAGPIRVRSGTLDGRERGSGGAECEKSVSVAARPDNRF